MPADMDGRDLGRALFPSRERHGHRDFVDLDYPATFEEPQKAHITNQLLCQKYRQLYPDQGYSYAHFCARYNYRKSSMRQNHKAGEKLFIDDCGPTMPIVNPDTGTLVVPAFFVAVNGCHLC